MPESGIVLRGVIAVLCLIGLYASYFMFRKFVKARRGGLDEPSVVTSPRAKIGRVPNATIGLIYYSLMLVLTPFLTRAHPLAVIGALVAAFAAAISSFYLAHSLLFVTRMPCRYCWTGHVVNWSLLALLIFIYTSR
jgi:uncharacterized membrane protein